MAAKKKLSAGEIKTLLSTLKTRFEKNMKRHEGIAWEKVEEKLKTNPDKLWSLHEMERTGGEPDVIAFDKLPAGKAGKTGEYIFYDCSVESPAGRRSVCYDAAALASRKENKPRHSAVGMATEMDVQLLSEEEYRALQQLEAFDLKTSSWIQTPEAIRKLGGALFCDRRYHHIFTYHNGAESYYAARGFRAALRL